MNLIDCREYIVAAAVVLFLLAVSGLVITGNYTTRTFGDAAVNK